MKKLQTIKLGGWHRLWIIVSVIYLIPVIDNTMEAFPKSLSDVPGSYSEEQASPGPDLTRAKRALINAQEAGDMEAVQTLAQYIRLHQTLAQKTVQTEAQQEPKKVNLRRAQATVVLEGFLAWVISIAALYFVGWSVGWVYKGFSKGESK